MIFLLILSVLSCLLIVFFLLRRSLYSVSFVAIIYCVVVLYSFFGVFLGDFAKSVPWGFSDYLSPQEVLDSLVVFSGFGFSLALGGVLACLLVGQKRVDDAFEIISLKAKRVSGRFGVIFFAVSVSPVVLLIISYGWDNLWFRSGYDMEGWSLGAMLARILVPISALSLALVGSLRWRALGFGLLYLALFSINSRSVILVPVIYLIGMFFVAGELSVFRVLVCSCLAILGAASVLNNRLDIYQGFYPGVTSFFFEGVDFSAILEGLNYVFSYSLVYFSYMSKYVVYDSEIFWVSVNPLPGNMVNIDLISDYARVAPRIPYSAIGEVYLFFGEGVFFFLFFFGFFVALMERMIFGWNWVFALFFIILLVVLGLMSTQYNLRGAARLFYYSVLIFLFSFSWSLFSRFCLPLARAEEMKCAKLHW